MTAPKSAPDLAAQFADTPSQERHRTRALNDFIAKQTPPLPCEAPMSKSFPTSAVLSCVTGRLLGEIGGVYEVLNYMSGESLFTHQLPRVGKEALPHILALHPELAVTIEEAEAVTGENWKAWLDTWVARYGDTITVPLMTADQHQVIGPIAELEGLTSKPIIVISTDGDAAIARATGGAA